MGVLKESQKTWNTVLLFARTHERKLGAGLFALGFLTDLFTFGLLPPEIVNWFFVSYLALAAVTILGAHSVSIFKERDAWWKKTFAVLFPLGAQYAFGGLFSGFVVFYARSSVFAVSWPFLLLLALVYAGNEYFRLHREHLVFQTLLFFVALYAYAIFALPFLIGKIGPWTFMGSTVAAVVLFALFLWTLSLINKKRLFENIRLTTAATGAVTLVICLSYFSGLIPPLPLALSEEGVYHSVTKVAGGYTVETEQKAPWWHIGPPTVHVTPSGSVSVYSAVRAPISFSSSVVHRWQYLDETKGDWVTASRISFPLSGGRSEGYRGYSTKGSLVEGKWRVSVETPNGQTIGRIRFDVVFVETPPALILETR